MKTLRTPDDRFADLPGYDFEPHYADVADSDGGALRVHYLRRGGPVGTRGAPPARRAVLVLPVPHHDPRPDRGRAAGRRARPGRLRTLGQAHRAGRLHVRPARRVDARAPLRPPRPARGHAGLPGLGRADRAAPGGGAPGPLRPGGRGQHVPSHRGHQPGRGLLRLAALLAGGRAVPDRGHRPGWVCQAGVPRGGGGLRRAVPRRVVQGRGPGLPHAGAVPPRRPRPRRQRRRLGGPGRLRPPLPVRLQRR